MKIIPVKTSRLIPSLLGAMMSLACFANNPFADNPSVDNPNSGSFSHALTLQKAGQWAEAHAAWSEFLHQNPQSRPAHWNLGLVCLQEQKPDCVASEWMRALELSTSFADTAFLLDSLGQFQNSLGLPETATRSYLFATSAYVGRNTAFFLMMLTFWFVLAAGISLGRKYIPRTFWAGLAGVAALGCLGAHFAGANWKSFSVVGHPSGSISVYPEPGASTPTASLPSGAIVRISGRQSYRSEISLPVPGWIEGSEVISSPNQ